MDGNLEPFSKLEAGFAEIEIERRPISVHVEATSRFAGSSDHLVKDLDFNYDILDQVRTGGLLSMQGILPALQYNHHMENSNNFANKTEILCFDHTAKKTTLTTLDTAGLDRILSSVEPEDVGDAICRDPLMAGNLSSNTVPTSTVADPALNPNADCHIHNSTATTPSQPATDPTAETNIDERLVVFFLPLLPKGGTSFASQAPIERASVQKMFTVLDVNPEYLLNLIGRPDYWSPRTRWRRTAKDELIGVDYFCQYPRWNVLAQGAPVSLYVTLRLKTKLTVYILSHKPTDTSIHALQQILKVICKAHPTPNLSSSYLRNPFEIAVLLSSLSLEASKFHVGRFRRYMWQQFNKVDDHLSGLEFSNRDHLTELTKTLQIISQQADSHLLNANVAILTAKGTYDVQRKLHNHLSTPLVFRQAAEDAIEYVISSMEKQKMLFLNYKSRKNGTMSLVYNLVTQSDAANNIQLSRSMKRDSTNMTGIAALTMVFLPGTFTSSILSAGIFSAKAGSQGISTSSLWWLWVALTLPLTLIVMAVWWLYQHRTRLAKQNVTKAATV